MSDDSTTTTTTAAPSDPPAGSTTAAPDGTAPTITAQIAVDPYDGSAQAEHSVQVPVSAKLTLTWTGVNAASVNIDGIGDGQAETGSQPIATADATFTLVAVGPDGTQSPPLVLTVVTHPDGDVVSGHSDLSSGAAVVVSFTASKDNACITHASVGDTVTLTAIVSESTDAVTIDGASVDLSATADGHKQAVTSITIADGDSGDHSCTASANGTDGDPANLHLDIGPAAAAGGASTTTTQAVNNSAPNSSTTQPPTTTTHPPTSTTHPPTTTTHPPTTTTHPASTTTHPQTTTTHPGSTTTKAVLKYPPGTNAASQAGIDALVKAMNDMGFNGKYGRATLLGIAGGESHWVPKQEGYYYSQARLTQIFPFLNKHPDLITKLTGWKGSREEFFSYIYGPTLRGKGFLGNQTDEDGGKYYGRGFIQLTGRGNYSKYGSLAGVDLINNPDGLDSDLNMSARVAVAYMIDRCHADPTTEAYIQAGISAVGYNSPDIMKTKLGYVDFFVKNGTGGGSS